MGYCACGDGIVTVRTDMTVEQLGKLYPELWVSGEVFSIHDKQVTIKNIRDFLVLLRNEAEGFSEIYLDGWNTDVTQEIGFILYRGEKYHEDEVAETLKLFAPITVSGEITFVGEDDELWKFRFDGENFVEGSGTVVYDCDPPMLDARFPRLTEVTEIHAVRMDGLRVDQNVVVSVFHEKGIDLMDAIDRCFTDWYRTPEGKKAFEYTSKDYNIGDWCCGERPSDVFTSRYGFVLNVDALRERVLEINYDRVLGHETEEEKE